MELQTETQTINLPISIINAAKVYAENNMRTTQDQITYWAAIGKAAEDNPDLPVSFIADIIKASKEESIPFER